MKTAEERAKRYRLKQAARDYVSNTNCTYDDAFIAGAEFVSTENEAEKRNKVIQECIDDIKDIFGYNHSAQLIRHRLEKLKTSTPSKAINDEMLSSDQRYIDVSENI